MANLRSAFGSNLKLVRKSRGITQEKLAEFIDINPRQLAKIEAGDHFPSSKTLEKLCRVLCVKPFELFDFEICDENCKVDTPHDKEEEKRRKNILKMTDKFKKIADNDEYVNYILIAIDSIQSKKALSRLEFMIEGMKLGQKMKV